MGGIAERGQGLVLSSLSLLVVDDSHFMRSLMRALLKAFGVGRVLEAQDGVEALEMLHDGVVPDILVTDWNMPRLDGLRLTRAVRARERSPDPYLPVVMVTAHSDRRHLISAIDAGVNEFLSKPVSARTLYKHLHAAITRPRMFVSTDTYFGPDRRRLAAARYRGPERRRPPPDDPKAGGARDLL